MIRFTCTQAQPISPELEFERIAQGHVTSYAVYADFGLTNGVTYGYVVRWLGADGRESPDSNEASAMPRGR